MNFLDKIKTNSNILSFLSMYDFNIDTCGWGCCKGWNNTYVSCSGLYYNHITVWIEDEIVYISWHQEYECGGDTGFNKDWIPLEQATEEYILQVINDLLPDNLE